MGDRLISADALDRSLADAQAKCKKSGGNFRFGVLSNVRANIADAPTIDAIPVDWIKLNIAISALIEDDEAASLLLTLVDTWHKSGWSLFDGVLPAEEAKKYGIKPRETAP